MAIVIESEELNPSSFIEVAYKKIYDKVMIAQKINW